MQVYYCDGWFRAKKFATDIWDEAKAKAAYERREPHTVLVESIESPFCFLEFNRDYIGVEFLDDHRREFLAYQFQEDEPSKLFLSMAVSRRFVGESDEVASGTCYLFKKDGRMIVRRKDCRKGVEQRLERSVDVSINWEPYPQFGEYASISRIDRGIGGRWIKAI